MYNWITLLHIWNGPSTVNELYFHKMQKENVPGYLPSAPGSETPWLQALKVNSEGTGVNTAPPPVSKSVLPQQVARVSLSSQGGCSSPFHSTRSCNHFEPVAKWVLIPLQAHFAPDLQVKGAWGWENRKSHVEIYFFLVSKIVYREHTFLSMAPYNIFRCSHCAGKIGVWNGDG